MLVEIRLILPSFSNINLSRPYPERREKINRHFYFYTSLWCLKRFYKGFISGPHKTFWDTTKKCDSKNLS